MLQPWTGTKGLQLIVYGQMKEEREREKHRCNISISYSEILVLCSKHLSSHLFRETDKEEKASNFTQYLTDLVTSIQLQIQSI